MTRRFPTLPARPAHPRLLAKDLLTVTAACGGDGGETERPPPHRGRCDLRPEGVHRRRGARLRWRHARLHRLDEHARRHRGRPIEQIYKDYVCQVRRAEQLDGQFVTEPAMIFM